MYVSFTGPISEVTTVLIFPLYIPSGTDQAHSRSATDAELMKSLRNLFSQRDVQGFSGRELSQAPGPTSTA